MSGLRRLLLTAGTAAALTTCGPVAAQAFTDNLIVNTTLDAGHTDNPHYCTEDGEEGGTVCPLRAALELAQQTIGGAGTEIRVLVPAGTYLLNGFKGPLPLGNTGTRMIVTLIHELQKRGQEIGLTGACVGGGQGAGSVVKLEA